MLFLRYNCTVMILFDTLYLSTLRMACFLRALIFLFLFLYQDDRILEQTVAAWHPEMDALAVDSQYNFNNNAATG